MKNLVTPEWLRENLHKKGIVAADCRFKLEDPEYGRKKYNESHIEGAVFIDMKKDLTGKTGEHGGRHPLPEISEFAEGMESKGLDDNSTIIIYDDGDLSGASRLWWLLRLIGKNEAYVLEGGFNAWVQLGFETSTEIPQIKKSGNLTLTIHSDMYCSKDYVKSSIGNEKTIIVDSRSAERYRGIVEPIDKAAGHIPGSVNYFWQEVLDDSRLKDINSLKSHFSKLFNYESIIVHCGSGITACPNIIAMEEIGLKPVLYPGGWSDWISYEDNEIVSEK